MNIVKYMILALLFLTNATAQGLTMIDTKVTITNIATNKGGQLVIYVFFEKGFPKVHEDALIKKIVPISEKTISLTLSVPVDKNFAIKVHHDEDKDEKVAKNWTGIIPKDGLGFSNGAKILFGPPNFDAAKINHSVDTPISISLQY